MLGDDFQVEVLTWHLAHLAVEMGYLHMLSDFEQLPTGLSQAPRNTEKQRVPRIF